MLEMKSKRCRKIIPRHGFVWYHNRRTTKKTHTEIIAYLVPTVERTSSVEYPTWFYLISTTCKRVQTPSNVPIERSQRDLSKFSPPFSLRVPPPCFGQKRRRIARPSGRYLEWHIIRYHADKAQNNKPVQPKDLTHLRMMSSLSIAMRSLLPDVEGDRSRGLQSIEVLQV